MDNSFDELFDLLESINNALNDFGSTDRVFFYDSEGNLITIKDWIELYELYYYSDSEDIKSKVTKKRNKTNKYIERKVENILRNGLTPSDVIFVIAWSIGAINRIESSPNQIVYCDNFDKTLKFRTQYGIINAESIVNFCITNCNKLSADALDGKWLFEQLYNNRGYKSNFDVVHCLSLVYFFSRGYWPIYNRFAHIAVTAISDNIKPGNSVLCRELNSWDDYYQEYAERVKHIFGIRNISRRIHRALWVYGHFYNP